MFQVKVNEVLGEVGYEGTITVIGPNGAEVFDLAPSPKSKKINSPVKAVEMVKLSAQYDLMNAKNKYAPEAIIAGKIVAQAEALLDAPEQLAFAA